MTIIVDESCLTRKSNDMLWIHDLVNTILLRYAIYFPRKDILFALWYEHVIFDKCVCLIGHLAMFICTTPNNKLFLTNPFEYRNNKDTVLWNYKLNNTKNWIYKKIVRRVKLQFEKERNVHFFTFSMGDIAYRNRTVRLY